MSFNFNFKVVLAFLSSTEYLNSWSFVKRFIMEEDYTADIGDIIDSVVDILYCPKYYEFIKVKKYILKSRSYF